MEKEFGKLSREQLKDLFSHHVKYTEERKELKPLISEKAEKLSKYLEQVIPWNQWYNLPFNKFLVVVLDGFGLMDDFKEAGKSEDPQQTILDLMKADQKDDEIDDFFDEASDEEKGYFFSLFFALDFNLRSLRIFSKYLSQLVEEAKDNDEALLNAVLVDPSVIAIPHFSKRIQLAVMKNDTKFLDQLSKAIAKTRPRRPEKSLDDTRFVLALFEEAKPYIKLKPKQIYELLTKELRAYPGIDNNTYETFRRYYHRHQKSVT